MDALHGLFPIPDKLDWAYKAVLSSKRKGIIEGSNTMFRTFMREDDVVVGLALFQVPDDTAPETIVAVGNLIPLITVSPTDPKNAWRRLKRWYRNFAALAGGSEWAPPNVAVTVQRVRPEEVSVLLEVKREMSAIALDSPSDALGVGVLHRLTGTVCWPEEQFQRWVAAAVRFQGVVFHLWDFHRRPSHAEFLIIPMHQVQIRW